MCLGVFIIVLLFLSLMLINYSECYLYRIKVYIEFYISFYLFTKCNIYLLYESYQFPIHDQLIDWHISSYSYVQ